MRNEIAIVNYHDQTIAAYLKDDELFELYVVQQDKPQFLQNIYVGKVKNIIKNISAVFVEIEEKQICYMPLKEEKNAVFISRKRSTGLTEGDEILVQVVKEGVKSKAPTVTTKLSLAGRYAVLTKGNTKLSVSSKISSEEDRNRLEELANPFLSSEYGWIMRTNSTEASDIQIIEEMTELQKKYNDLMNFGVCRTCYSCVYRTPDDWILYIRNHMNQELERVITDIPQYHQNLFETFSLKKDEQEKIRLYDDESYPLIKLLGLETKIERVLNKKVWLKSGGSIVIEPTEALTSIDVNTEKAIRGNRNPESTFLKINKEAAKEIGKQLQVRNLSGIIIVDFIDLKNKEDREELLHYFRQILRNDPVKTMLIDMTPLGLVELTRMKVRKPLHEVLKVKK